MSTIKVLLTGTGGIPGRNILSAFEEYQQKRSTSQDISFEVTILKRQPSNTSSEAPDVQASPHNTIYVSDFANTSDLSAKISSLSPDIIVSALNAEPAPTLDNHLLDAILKHLSSTSVSADTSSSTSSRRHPLLFINGFTLDLLHPDVKRILNTTQYATLEPKIAFANRLASTADAHGSSFAYATVVCAGFLDYCLVKGYLGIDLDARKATLHDNGSKILTGCSLRFVGDAVVAIALRYLSQASTQSPAPASVQTQRHDEVRNRRVRIAETFFSGRDLLDVVEQCVGKQFDVKNDSSADMLKKGSVISYLNWSEFSRASTFTDDGLDFDDEGYLAGKRRTLRAICKEAVAGGVQMFEGIGR